jgi:hypothetical protein
MHGCVAAIAVACGEYSGIIVAAAAVTGEMYAVAAVAERARRAKKKAKTLAAIFAKSCLMLLNV